MNYEEIKNEISAANFHSGKFSPKLEGWRYQIVALHLAGVPIKVIANAFDVRPQTISKMFSVNSNRYRKEQAELEEIGSEAFQAKYLTAEAWAKVKSVAASDSPKALKNAKSKDGVHIVKTDMCERQHRIIIGWRDADETNVGAGWYYQDHDGPVADRGTWYHNGDESRMTSTACLKAVEENLFDFPLEE